MNFIYETVTTMGDHAKAIRELNKGCRTANLCIILLNLGLLGILSIEYNHEKRIQALESARK